MTDNTAHKAKRLRDVASFVRSKNAGPFMLTIDFFFPDTETLKRVWQSSVLSASRIAAIYGIKEEVVTVMQIPQSNALKVSFPRPRPAGDPGDADVAGGQQFLPLLDLIIDGA